MNNHPIYRLVESNNLQSYDDWGCFLEAIDSAIKAGRTITVRGELYHDLNSFVEGHNGSESVVVRILKSQGVDGTTS